MIEKHRFRGRLSAFVAVVLATGTMATAILLAEARIGQATVSGVMSTTGSPKLVPRGDCPTDADFACYTLTVPLDHSGRVDGTLDLQVAAAKNVDAPRGVLLMLNGGPGQPSEMFVGALADRTPALNAFYRWVSIDQRGTGANALKCPKLQQEYRSSDIVAPSREAVRACGELLGANRQFYRTEDTLADLELLRRALGVQKMSLNGLSYGTRTAALYALARPGNVNMVVLDSPMPFADPERDDTLNLAPMRAHRQVLRAACAAVSGCDWDPVKDLAWLVRQRGDGVKLLDLMVAGGFADPNYSRIIKAMHAARQGNPADLNKLLANLADGQPMPYEWFSWGLSNATFCADMRFPWGDAATPLMQRPAPLERATRRLRPEDTYPYDRATATRQGFVWRCLMWPVSRPSKEPPANAKIQVPTLLLHGDRDLSTPREWADEVAERALQRKLVVSPGSPHIVQLMEPSTRGRDAMVAFLTQPR
ncbi:alpha/beta fold hydrolase [Nonomuraea sp. NPDC050663]|uniref:alpha/beta fold hydrolase n=1 Tax=Nonomuraea sp. NPDC050663 TaxID=3364370 RepID=UPI00378CE282